LNYVRKKKKTQNKQKRRLSFFVENNWIKTISPSSYASKYDISLKYPSFPKNDFRIFFYTKLIFLLSDSNLHLFTVNNSILPRYQKIWAEI
jgi:hypothetical protein